LKTGNCSERSETEGLQTCREAKAGTRAQA
jgi:hypothetical protein